jgi:hypothetical protein
MAETEVRRPLLMTVTPDIVIAQLAASFGRSAADLLASIGRVQQQLTTHWDSFRTVSAIGRAFIPAAFNASVVLPQSTPWELFHEGENKTSSPLQYSLFDDATRNCESRCLDDRMESYCMPCH